MDTLSSCYFCGSALDASVDEYPVVPERYRGGGSDQSVVLCDSCARKLDAVIDSVVTAVEDGAGGRAAGSAAEPESVPGLEPEGDGDEDVDLEETLGDDEDLLQSVRDEDEPAADAADDGGSADGEASASEGTEATGDEEDDGDGGDDGTEKRYTDSRGAGFQGGSNKSPHRSLTDSSDDDAKKYTDSRGAGYRRDDPGTNQWSVRDSDEEADADDGSSDAEDGSSDAEGDADDDDSGGKEKRYTDGRRAGYRGDDDSAPDSSDDGDSSGGDEADDWESKAPDSSESSSGADEKTGASESSQDTPDVSMSRLENTKVMRLLENREFPVDKEEFVTVAASAYQISRGDCEKVLELAVQHGLIHEEDGQLLGGEL